MRLRRGVACLVAVLALVGCAAPAGNGDRADAPGRLGEPAERTPPASSGHVTSTVDFPSYAATALAESVDVLDAAGGSVRAVLESPLPSGAPLTFLVKREAGDWLEVYLPVRPNGSSGWVRADAVLVEGVPFRLDVRLGAHELALYEFGALVRTYPIGVGRGNTPTPGGVFYLKELLRPPDPDGPYGPFAFGLSGYSTTLESFAGTDAVIGIHGTSDPSSIGRDASHGCIRLHNTDITELAELLPLGTPVTIQP